MTYEEALQSVLRYCSEECGKIDTCRGEDKECAEAAVMKALEKQIPKKPIIRKAEDYFGNVKHTLCPHCQETEFVSTQPCFCHHCGQAIDWRDDE